MRTARKIGVDGRGEDYHRVGGRGDRGLPSGVQRLANLHVVEMRSGDQPVRKLFWRFLAQHLAHERIVRAEVAAHGRKQPRDSELFQILINRDRCRDASLDAHQPLVGVLRQALAVRLSALGRRAHQRDGIIEQVRPEKSVRRSASREKLRAHHLDLRDVVPCRRVCGELGVGRNRLAKVLLFLHLRAEKFRVHQRPLPAEIRLEGVRDEEDGFVCLARLLGTLRSELLHKPAKLRDVWHGRRIERVAIERQLRDGEFTAGAAGIAGHEHEIALFRAVGAPLQIIGARGRMIVFVRAHDADVEVEAGKIEIVGIAAELRHGHFRGEDEPDVVVALVAVQIVDAALVERDHLAKHGGIGAATLLQFSLFGVERGVGGAARFAGYRLQHVRRHVADLGELIELECRDTSARRPLFAPRNPFRRSFAAAVDNSWTQSSTQWWFVMTRPCGEMNDAEQPPAMRNDEARTWSSHACEGAKPYFVPTVFDGKLSNVHMPSSARNISGPARQATSKPTSKAANVDLQFVFIGKFPLSAGRLDANRNFGVGFGSGQIVHPVCLACAARMIWYRRKQERPDSRAESLPGRAGRREEPLFRPAAKGLNVAPRFSAASSLCVSPGPSVRGGGV